MPYIGYAQSIQPIIHNKTYSGLSVPLKNFGKPERIIKGGENECSGGFFPNQYVYRDVTLSDQGQVYSVIMNRNNGLVFYHKKIDASMGKTKFLQLFKDLVWQSEEHPNVYYAESEEDSTTIITFIFKDERLIKYKISTNDC